MGLTTVGGIPKDARHQELQDVKLPNGSLVQQFRLSDGDSSDQVFEKITDASGRERFYRLAPDAQLQGGPYTRGYDEGLRDVVEGRVPRVHHSSITREERRGYRDGWRDGQERSATAEPSQADAKVDA